jgi:hypothetical protein
MSNQYPHLMLHNAVLFLRTLLVCGLARCHSSWRASRQWCMGLADLSASCLLCCAAYLDCVQVGMLLQQLA